MFIQFPNFKQNFIYNKKKFLLRKVKEKNPDVIAVLSSYKTCPRDEVLATGWRAIFEKAPVEDEVDYMDKVESLREEIENEG